jgi:hypothetical protein
LPEASVHVFCCASLQQLQVFRSALEIFEATGLWRSKMCTCLCYYVLILAHNYPFLVLYVLLLLLLLLLQATC